jgi:hypothetical protein
MPTLILPLNVKGLDYDNTSLRPEFPVIVIANTVFWHLLIAALMRKRRTVGSGTTGRLYIHDLRLNNHLRQR